VTTKTCHKCKRILPLEDFYKSKSSKDGYAPSCKDCQWGTPLGTKTSNGDAAHDVVIKKVEPKARKEVLVPQSTLNAHGLIPTEEPSGSNIKCDAKAEKDSKKVYQKAKKLVESNDEHIIKSEIYMVPGRNDYQGSFDWDQVYGKKCSVCHQKYKEGERYMVVGMHLDTIVTRHEVCW